MMVPSLSVIWDRGLDVLSTFFDEVTGTLLANLGNARVDEQSSDGAEVWQWWGFASRPPQPRERREGAQVILLRGADRDAVIGGRDLRANELYRALGDGETCLYAAGASGTGQARIVLRGDGSLEIFTAGGSGELRVTLDPKGSIVRLQHPKGHAITLSDSGIALDAGTSSLRLGADGSAKLSGSGAASVDGATVLLGLGAAPALPGINSAVLGAGGLLTTASSRVFVAP